MHTKLQSKDMTKSNDIINKNLPRVQNGKTNHKQQLSDLSYT